MDRERWTRIRRGFVLTIDYGHEARVLYNERHNRGTLLATGIMVTENLLDVPGGQDLTSHVNFTAVEFVGTSRRP